MLMEAILIKNLFSSSQQCPEREKPVVTTSTRSGTCMVLQRGASTWTKKGEWLQGGESQKLRLMVTDHPQAFIAVQDDNPNKGFYERMRDRFSHVAVKGKGDDGKEDAVSLNIGSLSKRTHLSVATLLLLRFTGRLTLEFVEQCARKAQQHNEVFNQIIQNGRIRAIELGHDPDDKEIELRDVVQTVLKSRKLAKGILAQRGGTTYIAHGENNHFAIKEKQDLLGQGTYGMVYEVRNLVTGTLEAAKFAKQEDKKAGYQNENTILSIVHKDGHVKGVQDAPYFVIEGLGYVTREYDYTLNDADFLKLTPLREKLIRAQMLFNGLHGLHSKGGGIVHCDIKPANCCSVGGELQIADFGHARLCANVSPEQPLGICTRYFTSSSDQREDKRITISYCMHQIAIGKVTNPVGKAWLLQTAIAHDTFDIDRQAAKYTLAALLMKLDPEKLTALGIKVDDYQAEMETIRSNPAALKTRQLDFTNYRLSKEQMAQLKADSISLCKSHDVDGLARTLLCIYLGKEYISHRAIPSALTALSKQPELQGIAGDLSKLLTEMMHRDAAKRPTIEDAMNRYQTIIAGLILDDHPDQQHEVA